MDWAVVRPPRTCSSASAVSTPSRGACARLTPSQWRCSACGLVHERLAAKCPSCRGDAPCHVARAFAQLLVLRSELCSIPAAHLSEHTAGCAGCTGGTDAQAQAVQQQVDELVRAGAAFHGASTERNSSQPRVARAAERLIACHDTCSSIFHAQRQVLAKIETLEPGYTERCREHKALDIALSTTQQAMESAQRFRARTREIERAMEALPILLAKRAALHRARALGLAIKAEMAGYLGEEAYSDAALCAWPQVDNLLEHTNNQVLASIERIREASTPDFACPIAIRGAVCQAEAELAAGNAALQAVPRELATAATGDQLSCQVCFHGYQESSQPVAFGCGHVSCGTCAQQLNECHMCRTWIERRTRLFL